MQLQLNLTDQPVQTVTPAQSRERSRSAKRDAYKLTQMHQALVVLAAIHDAGSVGATRHEIADRLCIPLSSVCGRVNELLSIEQPKVYVAEFRRDGRSVLISRG